MHLKRGLFHVEFWKPSNGIQSQKRLPLHCSVESKSITPCVRSVPRKHLIILTVVLGWVDGVRQWNPNNLCCVLYKCSSFWDGSHPCIISKHAGRQKDSELPVSNEKRPPAPLVVLHLAPGCRRQIVGRETEPLHRTRIVSELVKRLDVRDIVRLVDRR